MSISLDEVKHIAYLSRLHLTDEEAEVFTGHLSHILEYVEKLQTLNVDDVEPLSHAVPMSNIMRNDEITLEMTNEDALANAPDKQEPYFRVPRVTE